jgi:hypothetical protein
MSGIGGPLLVGLTVFLGAFGAFTVSRMMGSRDTTPVTDYTSSGGNEDQSNPQPKVQNPAKDKQSMTSAGPKDHTVSKSTESGTVEKPIVTVSPTKTEPSLGPVSPQGGGAKANNASVDKRKELEENMKPAIEKLVDIYTHLKSGTLADVVVEPTNELSNKICEMYLEMLTEDRAEIAKNILADWTKLKENYDFLAINPRNYLLIKNAKKSEDYFVPDRLLKANALCGELKTQEAKNALREAVNKSLIDFLPDKLALDAKIKVTPINSRAQITVSRKTVTWKKGESLTSQLTSDPAETNECSGGDAIKWIYNKQTTVTVEPLRSSENAFKYTQLRNNLKIINHDGVSALRKLVLEDIQPNKIKEWNELPRFEASPGAPASNLYNRVKIVVDALNNPALSNLFPKGEKTPMATSP